MRRTATLLCIAGSLHLLGGCAPLKPDARSGGEEALNMRLVGYEPLQARSAYQPTIQHQGARWIAYIGHHGDLKRNPLSGRDEDNGTSIVDVTDPAHPRYLAHIPGEPGKAEQGGAQMVRVCAGAQLPRADKSRFYMLRTFGNQAHEVWDVTTPEKPELVTKVVTGLKGTHKNFWECDTGIAYLVSGDPAWRTARMTKIYDLSDPAHPVFIRDFGLVGQQPGATGPVPIALHGPISTGPRGNRVYFGYGTSTDGVLQIVDRDKLLNGPKEPTPQNLLAPQVSRLDMPPIHGAHTVFPLLGVDVPEFAHNLLGRKRDFVVITDEAIQKECLEGRQQVWFVDVTTETRPFGVSNFTVPEASGNFCSRGGRFGTHSSNENMTPLFYGRLMFFAHFNAGVRVLDVRDPMRPVEVAHYIPAITDATVVLEAPASAAGANLPFTAASQRRAIQTNNVEVDDRGYVYIVDRANTGLHILELTGPARQIADWSKAAGQQSAAPPASDAVVAAPRYGTWGLDTAGMDLSVKPGDDFFTYAAGTWLKTARIPPDRPSFGSFIQLRELSEARVLRLVESYRPGEASTTPDQAKVATLYRGFMDEAAIEALDATPLQARLADVRSATTKDDIARLMGRSAGGFGKSFFAPMVIDDAKNPEFYGVYLRQSGLGLGDRELYLDARFAAQKARYRQHVAHMLGLAGWAQPEAAAERIVGLETRIAQAHWTRGESRNRDKTYNPMTLGDLESRAPGFPWPVYVQAAGVETAGRYIVAQDTAFPKLAQVFAETDLETLKAWQAFHVTDGMAPLLSRRFDQAHFEFHSKFLDGQPEQRPRWKRGIAFAQQAMGEAIGRDYVALYYPPESRAIMDRMVADLRVALKHRIEGLQWMSAATKAQALAKLERFGVKVGHPSKWRDYTALEVRAGDLVGNAERAARFEWDFRRGRLGQHVDRAEWGMTPQTVNAYYNPVKNEIVFPAAILQPPFFDPKADPAVNYGGIGAVIGHEISHGFDDQGRKSDGNGMLRDWWTPGDAARFEAEAAKLGAQYEAYEFPNLPGMHINARASMGENIGDLGGVLIALDAYRNLLGGKPAPVIDGYTGEQRFFLGYAQLWRSVIRDDALRQQLATDPHSPARIRSFAPLRNVDAWYDAFGVQPGDKLYIAPADRVRIW